MTTQALKESCLTECPSSSNSLGMLPSRDHPSLSIGGVPIENAYEYDDYREMTLGWLGEEDEDEAGSVFVNEDEILSSLDQAIAICEDIGLAYTLQGKNSPLQTSAQGGTGAPAAEDGEAEDAPNQ